MRPASVHSGDTGAVEALVLLVEDDRSIRDVTRMGLSDAGFTVVTAGDGEEALGIVRRETVHVLLMDMHMPKLTGLETLRLVKRIKALMPCIILSADLNDLLIEQARRARAFYVLAKPVTRNQITGAVHEALATAYNWRIVRR